MEERLENSYRLLVCLDCRGQVKLCRRCDRGNIYCSAKCATERRKATQRRASRQYQKTTAGRRRHASRQSRYRQRKREAVTQQGSQPEGERDWLGEEKPLLEMVETKAEVQGQVQCTKCGRWCGPFARREPWHGGRHFRKYSDGNIKGNRSGDSPAALCGEVAKRNNRRSTANSSFIS